MKVLLRVLSLISQLLLECNVIQSFFWAVGSIWYLSVIVLSGVSTHAAAAAAAAAAALRQIWYLVFSTFTQLKRCRFGGRKLDDQRQSHWNWLSCFEIATWRWCTRAGCWRSHEAMDDHTRSGCILRKVGPHELTKINGFTQSCCECWTWIVLRWKAQLSVLHSARRNLTR